MKKLLSIFLLLFCLKSFGQNDGRYDFTLALQSHTSAGVYKTDSTLVRTLWSDSVLAAGTYTRYWDGKDDFGNTITSPDVTYNIRVVSNNVNYTWDGIIGNTSTNNTGSSVHKGYYTSMTGMAITGTTAYFCQGYSEGYSSQAKFSTLNPQVRLDLNGFGGRQSTMNCDYVATDGINVYWAGYNAYQLLVSSIVMATAVSNDAQVSFGANGTSYTMTALTNAKTYTSTIDLITNNTAGRPTGLAVSSSYLFVAHGGLNQVKVFNKTTGALAQTISVTNPRNIAINGSNLWMVSGTNTVAKYTINANGTISAATITLSGITTPGAIAATSSEVSVIDAGTIQIVRFFNSLSGAATTTIGTSGGYFTDATVTNTKFNFDDYRGNKYGFLAYVPDGSVWIGDVGNYRQLHYSAAKSYVEYIMSLGANYEVYADPNNPTRVFSGGLAGGGIVEFSIDYSQPLTGSTGWTLVKNWGVNVANNINYHKSLRFPATLSNGRTYAFIRKSNGITNQTVGAQAEFVELPSTGQLRFTGLLRNNDFIFAPDGSIQDITSANIGGTSTLGRYALTGFNGSDNPLWSGTREVLATMSNIGYNDPYNSRVLSNNVITASNKVVWWNPRIMSANGSTVDTGYHLGIMARGGSTLKFKTEQGTHVNYTGAYPGAGYFDIGNGVHDNAGGTLSTVDDIIITSYHGEFWKNYQTNYYNQYDQYGLAVGQFGTDQYLAGGASAAGAGSAGNALTPMLVKNASGNYFMYHGDESDHGGLHRWSISNLGSITAQTVNIAFPSSYVALPLGYVDLQAGLPFDAALPTAAGWSKSGVVSSYTNRKKYQNDGSPDVYTTFTNQSTGTGSVNRTLGSNNVNASWKISGIISFEGSDYTTGSKIMSYIDVLDAGGKILARFYYSYTSPTLTLYGNTSVVKTSPLTSVLNSLQPFEVSCVNGVFTFSYAGYAPVTATIYDGLGNWKTPTTLRQYWTTNGTPSYGKNIGFYNMRFYTDYIAASIRSYYFDATGGSDGGLGTIGSPFKTISKLNSIWSSLNPGDSVLFKRGETFYGGIIANKSGNNTNDIVIGAYGTGAAPIITGLRTLNTWTITGTSNVWTTPVISTLPSTTLQTFLVNGKLTAMGRFPNFNATNNGYLPITTHTGTSIIKANGLIGTPNWTGGEAVIRSAKYAIDRLNITTFVSASGSITYTGAQRTPTDGFGVFIQNSLLTLDIQNEWYHNKAAKTVQIYSVGNPSSSRIIEVAEINNLFSSNGVSYITIDSVDFKGSLGDAISIKNGRKINIRNSNISFAGIDGVRNDNSTNSSITNSNINYSLNTGLGIFADTAIVLDSKVNWSGLISGAGESTPNGYRGVMFRTSNSVFRYNSVDSSGSSGILLDGNNLVFARNFVGKHDSLKDDGGGGWYFQDLGKVMYNRRADSNIVINGMGAPEGVAGNVPSGVGVYFDDNANGISAKYNTIINATRPVLFHQAYNIRFSNNTVIGGTETQLYLQRDDVNLSVRNDTITNNIFFNTKNQYVVEYYEFGGYSDIGTLGRLDSNYYVAPVNVNNMFKTLTGSNVNAYYPSLLSWQSSFPQYDSHSIEIKNKWPSSVNVLDSIRIEYNATKTPKIVSLDGVNYTDVKGVAYSGSVTIQPYMSWIGLRSGTVSASTPTIAWGDQTVVYGSSLAPTQTATTHVSGIFSYNISGTPNAGVYSSYTVTFTPDDLGTWTTATKTVTLTITPKPITGTVTNTTVTYNSMPQGPILVTTPSLPYTYTLDGVGGAKTNAKAYVYVIGITDPNYSMTPLTGTFTINPQVISVTVNNTSLPYDSTLKNITITTIPAGITVLNSLTPKRYSGDYTGILTSGNSNYTFTPINFTFTITKGVVTLTSWNPTNLVYPNSIGAGQTNAIFNKNGIYSYSPNTGAILSAGSQVLRLDFTPSDTNLLPMLGITRSITVSKGTGTITLGSDTTQYADGTVKVITPIITPNVGTVNIVYTGSHTTPGDYNFIVTITDNNYTFASKQGTLHILSNAANIFITNYQNRVYTSSPINVTVNSNYSYTVTYNPTNHTNANNNIQVIATINDGIHIGADTVIMNIIKATPNYIWSSILDGQYPYIVTNGMLNGASSIAGIWRYNVNIGDTLSVGVNSIIGTFTPTDTVNYTNLVLTNTFTVTQQTGIITATNFDFVYDGTVKEITASVSPNVGTLVITYNGVQGGKIDVGTYTVLIHLNNPNVAATDVTGTMTISAANYLLNWPMVQPIQWGTTLSNVQFNATSNISGYFTYNYAIGTKLPTGTIALTATFHPDDLVNYAVQTITQSISVFGNPVNIIYIKKKGKLVPIQTP